MQRTKENVVAKKVNETSKQQLLQLELEFKYREQVFSRRSLLNKVENFKGVYINEDLTKGERERQYAMRKQDRET